MYSLIPVPKESIRMQGITIPRAQLKTLILRTGKIIINTIMTLLRISEISTTKGRHTKIITHNTTNGKEGNGNSGKDSNQIAINIKILMKHMINLDSKLSI